MKPSFLPLCLVVAVLAFPGVSRAQVTTCGAPTNCSGNDVQAWLRAGPSVLVMGAWEPGTKAADARAVFRLGTLSGFFIRPEVTLSTASFGRSGKFGAGFGARVLPLGFRWGEGFSLGGGRGHSLGFLAGVGVAGWYAGVTYEWKPCDWGGVVVEFTKNFGTALASPATLNVGLQFDYPSQPWRAATTP